MGNEAQRGQGLVHGRLHGWPSSPNTLPNIHTNRAQLSLGPGCPEPPRTCWKLLLVQSYRPLNCLFLLECTLHCVCVDMQPRVRMLCACESLGSCMCVVPTGVCEYVCEHASACKCYLCALTWHAEATSMYTFVRKCTFACLYYLCTHHHSCLYVHAHPARFCSIYCFCLPIL